MTIFVRFQIHSYWKDNRENEKVKYYITDINEIVSSLYKNESEAIQMIIVLAGYALDVNFKKN